MFCTLYGYVVPFTTYTLKSLYRSHDAYVDGVEGPACAGPTDDGLCELRVTEVPYEGGGAGLQCVAYCP